MLTKSNCVVLDEVDTNVSTFEQGSSHNILVPQISGSEMKNTFFGMMRPPPLIVLPLTPLCP